MSSATFAFVSMEASPGTLRKTGGEGGAARVGPMDQLAFTVREDRLLRRSGRSGVLRAMLG